MKAALAWLLRERKYWKPQSLTWWVGFALVIAGIFRQNEIMIPYLSPAVGPLIDAAFPGSNPMTLITVGAGYIGLRGSPGMSGKV